MTDPSLHSYSGLMLEMQCNYLHAYENLNEASHVSFLHHGFIDTGNVAAHPFREEVTEDRVSTVREFKDEPVFPYARMSYGLKSDVVDRQLRLTAIAPTLTTVSERYQEKGVENPRELLVRLVVPVTPASHKKCYQFVAAVRTLPAEPAPLFEGLRAFLQEDQIALADVQELFDSLPPDQRIEVSVKADNPAWRTRRILENMIKNERASPAVATAT